MPSGANAGYIQGDGVYKEFAPADRKPAVSFHSTTDAGKAVSSTQFLGTVHVLNFWYAGCPPCRLEAPDLEKVYQKYKGTVPFLGINTYDQAATAITFEKKFGITYPSVMDVNDTAVQYAFAGSIPANAVPTTLVIDRQGRVAARVTGLLEDKSILEAMIDTVIAEGK
nr:TlpA disulfide reductase family protein [Galbitalea soli]